jgi:heme/copper-type cytochrome/quinol oxidase subunit 3
MSPASPMEEAAEQFESLDQQRAAAELGMWVFLATEIMFFGPLFLGYAYGRWAFAASFAAASRHTDIIIGTANTVRRLRRRFSAMQQAVSLAFRVGYSAATDRGSIDAEYT